MSERLNVNQGTQNKGVIMRKAIEYFSQWKEGDINIWAKRLGFYCNIGTRAAKENYIEQAIAVGILTEHSGNVVVFNSEAIPDQYKAYHESKNEEIKENKKDKKNKPQKKTKGTMTDESLKILYDIYVKNCKKDEEEPTPFNDWKLDREFNEYVDRTGDTEITFKQWVEMNKVNQK